MMINHQIWKYPIVQSNPRRKENIGTIVNRMWIWKVKLLGVPTNGLVGGLEHVLLSKIDGMMIQSDSYFWQ
jgi:hypothetical protein